MKKKFFLRRLRPTDAERMLEWMKNKELMRYLRFDGEGMTLSDTQEFIIKAEDESENFHRAVTSEDGKYYGTVSLKNIDREKCEAEYAIALHAEAIGTGAAVCASRELLRIGFRQLLLKRIYLNVIRENQRAVRLYQKLGFQPFQSTTAVIKGDQTVILDWYEIGPLAAERNVKEEIAG